MKKKPYLTKAGVTQYKPVVSMGVLQNIVNEGNKGFCLACGNVSTGVEPDARKYTCEKCKAEKVYGFEELIIMGLI